MTRRVPGLALVCSCVALAAALVAPAAQASAVTTLSAQHITAKTAQLGATIVTGGFQTVWEFQYGTTAHLGKTTKALVIPAGKGTVAVHAEINQLTPNTKYYFRIAVTVATGNYYYPFIGGVGSELTFTTHKLGSTGFTSNTVKVKHGVAAFGLKCASTQSCAGSLKGTVKSHGKLITCVSAKFSIKAGKKGTVKSRVSNKCLVLLAKASHHRLKVSVTVTTTTGQPTVTKTITLRL